jgi:hypothetical protein
MPNEMVALFGFADAHATEKKLWYGAALLSQDIRKVVDVFSEKKPLPEMQGVLGKIVLCLFTDVAILPSISCGLG